jgi:hypothetical protein
VQFDDMKVSIDTPLGAVPELEDRGPAPEVTVLNARRGGLMAAFGLAAQNQLSPAITVKNPRTLPLPPRLANGTLARPGEADTSTMQAVRLSDGTYAVPNPSLHNNALVVARWHHWSYLPGTGWKLVGHAGAPVYQAAETASSLAVLTSAAEISGAAALGARLPGSAGLGVQSAELKRRPSKKVVNNTGMTGTSDPAIQQFINLILNQILGKLGGSNNMSHPSTGPSTNPSTNPITKPSGGTTNMNPMVGPSSFGPSSTGKGFSNGIGNNLPDGTANTAHGTGVHPTNSSGQPTGSSGTVTTVSKTAPSTGGTAPLTADPTIVANPFDGNSTMPFLTGGDLFEQGPAATMTNDFLTDELLNGSIADSNGNVTTAPPSTTGIGYDDGFNLSNPFDDPSNLTLENTAPPTDPTWPGSSGGSDDLFGSGSGSTPADDPFGSSDPLGGGDTGIDQPSYTAPDPLSDPPSSDFGLCADGTDSCYSDSSSSFDDTGDYSSDDTGGYDDSSGTDDGSGDFSDAGWV